MPPSPPTLRLPEKQTIFTESEDSVRKRKTEDTSSVVIRPLACLPFCPHFHSERREGAITPVSVFSHPSGQGKARPFLPNDPVSDLAGAVLLIEEIDDPDETPGLLPSDCKQVLPSRVGRKIEFLQRLIHSLIARRQDAKPHRTRFAAAEVQMNRYLSAYSQAAVQKQGSTVPHSLNSAKLRIVFS